MRNSASGPRSECAAARLEERADARETPTLTAAGATAVPVAAVALRPPREEMASVEVI